MVIAEKPDSQSEPCPICGFEDIQGQETCPNCGSWLGADTTEGMPSEPGTITDQERPEVEYQSTEEGPPLDSGAEEDLSAPLTVSEVEDLRGEPSPPEEIEPAQEPEKPARKRERFPPSRLKVPKEPVEAKPAEPEQPAAQTEEETSPIPVEPIAPPAPAKKKKSKPAKAKPRKKRRWSCAFIIVFVVIGWFGFSRLIDLIDSARVISQPGRATAISSTRAGISISTVTSDQLPPTVAAIPTEAIKIPTTLRGCTNGNMRIREAPDENSGTAGWIVSNVCAAFDARSEDDFWLHIAAGQDVNAGWVVIRFVDLEGDILSLPIWVDEGLTP